MIKIVKENGNYYNVGVRNAIFWIVRDFKIDSKKLVRFLKRTLKGIVRWTIKFLYLNLVKLERYLIRKIKNWEVE